MTNKVVRQSSKRANFVADKSRFLKQMSNKNSDWDKVILNYLNIKNKSL